MNEEPDIQMSGQREAEHTNIPAPITDKSESKELSIWQKLPVVSRRSVLKLSVAASVLAAMPVASFISPHTADAAPKVDRSSPIGQKWIKLGGAAVVGNPTTNVVSTPDKGAQYQQFVHGVIIFSMDWGAMFVSTAIFQKWLSLNNQTNATNDNLLSYVGFPTQDFVSANGIDTGTFERGTIIVQTATNTATVIYGPIYEHYLRINTILGLPTNEEANAANGGRFQSFAGGDIYWQGLTGAFSVQGAIRARWLALGGAGGTLGYPTSDEQPVKKDGNEIGRSGRFEKGGIYWSSGTGAFEILGALQVYYETQLGGPAAENGFGFPTSGQQNTPTSGGQFNNFQNGIVVSHTSGPFQGVWAFTKLEFFIQRLQGDGEDLVLGIGGNQDLYVHINIDTSTGTSIKVRRPEDGTYDGGEDIEETFELMPGAEIITSDFSFHVAMDAWDADDITDDDFLGKIDVTYSIDNLWGLLDGGPHKVNGDDDGTFTATYSVKNPLPFDPLKFRQNLFWSFSNFDTPELTYEQFGATFSDVDPDETKWLHPFNALYFNLAYKGIAANGNCFGMSLESIFAQENRSLYSEPIIRFWPDTQAGQRLNPNNPTHQPTINEINIKHGYQLGADVIDWTIGRFFSGNTHDPKQCFLDSREAFNKGDYPVISLTDSFFFGNGHAVRPYRWDDSDPDKWVIFIANPNNPASVSGDAADPCRIEIDTNSNTFTFRFDSGNTWSGSSWTGGRMFHIPFHRMSTTPRTPFWEVLALLVAGVILLVGSTGQTQQITDDSGRTLFEPGLSEPPTRWDQMRQDDNTRVPNLARIPLTDGPSGNIPLEMYYAVGQGATYTHELVPAKGIAEGTPIEWTMHSTLLSAHVVAPASSNADQITVHSLHTTDKAVTVKVPENGVSKAFTWTMAGPIKQRWLELSNLNLAPGQAVKISLSNGGYDATFNNSGSATTATLRVQAGPGVAPTIIENFTIPNGTSPILQFGAPITTLTAEGKNGKNGWFLSPIKVKLTAQDFSGTGIDFIEVSQNQIIWLTYHIPFLYLLEGSTKLYYRAQDKAGDLESIRTSEIKIDTFPPIVKIDTDKDKYTRTEQFAVHFSSFDPLPGSGIASTVGQFNGQNVNNGQKVDLFGLNLGTYTLKVTAEDVAGWSTSKSDSIVLIATIDSLLATTQRFHTEGGISKDDVYKSLNQKLIDARVAHNIGNNIAAKALLRAFRDEVTAQTGKAVTAAAANILTMDSNFVINSL
ncbi:MAG TPA: hypothetical protein VFN35_28205 [Ktedonobacteraceae bacterium]|nr:hypothetical protein [Ktedonobacteraceae bacterium]